MRDPTSTSLGAILRHHRKRREMTLKRIADAAHCSESTISKIETGRVNPSLTMLRRLAQVLDINVSVFFADTGGQGVVSRAGERPIIDTDVLRQGDGVALERLAPYIDGCLLQANIHIVAPGGQSDGVISHVGEEIGYLICGALELEVDGELYRLAPGDSFHFASDLPHGYRNMGDEEARVLWVNTPPTF